MLALVVASLMVVGFVAPLATQDSDDEYAPQIDFTAGALNGGVVAEGEQFLLPPGGSLDHWEVPEIVDGGGIRGLLERPMPFPDTDTESGNFCEVRGPICTMGFRPIAVTPEEAEEIEPGLPVITINDLAIFMPAKPEGAVEPDVAGVTGMPVNVVASAAQHIRTGTLFEYPVEVEFTPAGFRFSFGDGATLDAATGGASWEALGQAEFTPTATSHVYAQRGTYSASVDVSYTARVNFGTGWIVVPGTLTATSSLGEIRVVDVATGLVDKTCIENPSGPGC